MFTCVSIATAWQIPGMLSPCMDAVGDMSAPVAAKSTRRQSPQVMRWRMWPQSTDALHPQPLPPAL